MNSVCLSGNLTRSPEIRSTQSGMNILNFGIAVNDRRKNNSTGAWEEYANFIDCVLFGARAEFLSQNLKKGMRVALEGKLHYSTWERDGQKRSKIEVFVNDLDFVTPRQNTAQAPQSAPQGQQYQQQGNYANQQQNAPQGAYQQPQGYQQQGYQQYQQPDLYDENVAF